MQKVATQFFTRASLRADLERLGVEAGDTLMVHAAMRRVGPLIAGPDTLISALLDVVGSRGTLMAYTDWNRGHDELRNENGRIPPEWRPHIPPFEPLRSRAIRSHGILAEFIRTTPGALRSGNPGASVTALGARADWLTRDHPLDYGYGPGAPLAKLVEAGGKVLMAGAPLETMTLLHHAEHLARIPGKRIRRTEVPLATRAGVCWRMVEEFETGRPVVEGLPEDYFETIVRHFLDTGSGRQGSIGAATSVLVEAASICDFAVKWLERRSSD